MAYPDQWNVLVYDPLDELNNLTLRGDLSVGKDHPIESSRIRDDASHIASHVVDMDGGAGNKAFVDEEVFGIQGHMIQSSRIDSWDHNFMLKANVNDGVRQADLLQVVEDILLLLALSARSIPGGSPMRAKSPLTVSRIFMTFFGGATVDHMLGTNRFTPACNAASAKGIWSNV